MNKEITRSPKKHEFLLNFAKSPPLSVDHYEFLSVQPHSKDSVNDPDDQHSFHQDRLMTATDYISGKQPPFPSYFPYSKKSHVKKKSFDQQKDSVTYHQSTPSTTTNAKSINKSSISRGSTRPNPSQHTNFLNSKEFAKFALSKVLPRDIKRERGVHVELSPPQKDSKPSSLEKRSPKAMLKEDPSKNAKLSALQAKKQKVKLRASNLTSHDFSSLLDQTRHIHSFINSPQRRNPVQIYLPSKSTANLRPMSTKNLSNSNKNTWQHASIDTFKRLEANLPKKSSPQQYNVAPSSEDTRPKERNKGMQSIASILNLRREQKLSPDQKVNSCYPASNYHRKVASIGCGAQNSACSLSTNYPPNSHHPISQTASVQEDHKSSVARSQSHATKSSVSPSKRDPSSGKAKIEDEGRMAVHDINSEHFLRLQQTFDSLLEKYKGDIQNVQESYGMLKQIKEAYEIFTIELFNKIATQREVLGQEERNFKERCEMLLKEKIILEEEMKELRAENHKLYSLISERRSRERPDVSLREESKRSEEDNMDYLSANKYIHKGHDDIEELKRMIINQQGTIHELRNKEAKLMQLIYSIHKHGFDVEKLINEEASRGSEHFEHNVSTSSKHHFDSRKEHSERENPLDVSDKMDMGSMVTIGELSDFLVPDSKGLAAKQNPSDAKTSDVTPYLLGNTHQALSGLLKDKLKLDFTGLPNQKTKKLQLDPNNIQQQPDNAEPLGFHDEFMAKIAEFSLSWRLEALNQRNNNNNI